MAWSTTTLRVDGKPWRKGIERETIGAAIRIADQVLIPHALAAFGEMGADPAVEAARHVLRWIERNPEDEAFTRRTAHQHLRRRFPNPDDLDPALALLEHLGYIRAMPEPRDAEDEPGSRRRGRRPSPRYAVNPIWRTQNSQGTQKSESEGNSEDIVNFENASRRAA